MTDIIIAIILTSVIVGATGYWLYPWTSKKPSKSYKIGGMADKEKVIDMRISGKLVPVIIGTWKRSGETAVYLPIDEERVIAGMAIRFAQVPAKSGAIGDVFIAKCKLKNRVEKAIETGKDIKEEDICVHINRTYWRYH